MGDSENVERRELLQRAQFHHHTGLGLLAVFQKQRILRQSDMNPGLFDFRERLYGAFQLSFECAGIVHLFGEVGNSEIGLVKQLVTPSA